MSANSDVEFCMMARLVWPFGHAGYTVVTIFFECPRPETWEGLGMLYTTVTMATGVVFSKPPHRRHVFL